MSSFWSSLNPGNITRENLQDLLRLIMVIATYLLFRPYLEQIFRRISGTPDRQQSQLQARVSAMVEEHENKKPAVDDAGAEQLDPKKTK